MFPPASSQTLPHNPQGPAHMDQGVTSSVTELPSGRCSSILRMCWTIHGLISNLSCFPSTPAPSKPLFHPTTFKKCLTVQTSSLSHWLFFAKIKMAPTGSKAHCVGKRIVPNCQNITVALRLHSFSKHQTLREYFVTGVRPR